MICTLIKQLQYELPGSWPFLFKWKKTIRSRLIDNARRDSFTDSPKSKYSLKSTPSLLMHAHCILTRWWYFFRQHYYSPSLHFPVHEECLFYLLAKIDISRIDISKRICIFHIFVLSQQYSNSTFSITFVKNTRF